MTRARPALPVLAVAATVLALALAAGAHAAAGTPGVSATVDRTSIRTELGHTFVFRTRIANDGAATAHGLIAHLNIVSLRGDVYVDPEDWSTNRTRYLRPVGAGGSQTITWRMKAVNSGRSASTSRSFPSAATTGLRHGAARRRRGRGQEDPECRRDPLGRARRADRDRPFHGWAQAAQAPRMMRSTGRRCLLLAVAALAARPPSLQPRMAHRP